MKNTLHLYSKMFLLAGLFLISSSCSEDFFETPTGNRIKPSQHYEYSIDAELSYLGCFVYLQDLMSDVVIADGMLSDMMEITDNSDKDMVNLYMHNLNQSNKYLDLSKFYKVIVNVNEVLPNLEKILEKDKDFDVTVYRLYLGGMITLRAWCYFLIAKLTNEACIINDDFTTFSSAKEPAYLNKTTVINTLITELSVYYDTKDLVRFPIDQLALLGELYLEKNDYENAAFYLKRCLDGPATEGAFKVDNSYDSEDWKNIFINSADQVQTVISAVPFSDKDGQPNFISAIFYDNYMAKPSNVIIDAFESQVQLLGDTGDIYRGLDVTYARFENEEPFIKKYNLDETEYSADMILYRDADIHLLLAEALNRMGESENALILLNHGMSQLTKKPDGFTAWSKNIGVRGRVHLEALTGNTVEEVEDLIIQERALELAFEGKRWFDLVRIANRRDDPSYLAKRVAAKIADPEKSQEIEDKLLNKDNWYLHVEK